MHSYINVFRLLSVFLCGIIFLGSARGAHGVANDTAKSVQISLLGYGDFSRSQKDVHIEWASTGERVCLWWNEGALARRVPSQWLILSTNGAFVSSWTNSLPKAEEVLADFPSLLTWHRWRERLTNAVGCAVDDNVSNLFRAIAPSPPFSLSAKIEMVRLQAADQVIWAKDFKLGRVDIMGFVGTEGRIDLFVGFANTEGRLLDPATGAVVGSLTYGHIETDDEALRRKRRFGLKYPGMDVSLKFSSSVLALDANKRRVAAGGSFDRRFRVVSLLPPFPLLFEANADENPAVPPGGTWRVYWVDFVASGKYLVVEYFFSAPRTGLAFRPTEVFETEHWGKVWQVEGLQVHSMTVSPDGKAMALIRDNTLEIGPFSCGKIDSDAVPHKR